MCHLARCGDSECLVELALRVLVGELTEEAATAFVKAKSSSRDDTETLHDGAWATKACIRDGVVLAS